MPETDFGERTEQPTFRRRRQARERGQVAKSQDLSAAIVLGGGLLLLNILGAGLADGLFRMMRDVLATAHGAEMSFAGARSAMLAVLTASAGVVLPLLAGLALVAVIGTLVQVGPVFSAHPLRPSLEKISPVQGLKRLFSARSLARLATSLLKVAVVGAVGYITLRSEIDRIVGLTGAPPAEVAAAYALLMLTLGLRVCLALVILGLADYGFQRWQHERGLKMTRHEVREELKEMEGDPYARARRRRIQRQLAVQRMMHDVPRADAVITNPTELAIALRYDAERMQAPRVLAKGAGHMARRIREVAAANRIPIVERKPLTRALYAQVEIGDEIPPDFYRAVAEVLAYVYQLTGRSPEAALAAAGSSSKRTD